MMALRTFMVATWLLGATTLMAQVKGEYAAVPPTYASLRSMRSGHTPMPSQLARLVTLRQDSIPLQRALMEIATQAGLGLSYDQALVTERHLVSVRLTRRSAADAFEEVLRGSGWTLFVSPRGQAAVIRDRHEDAPEGSITGTVTDAKSGDLIASALVVVDGTALRASSGDNGQFRIVGVSAGEHTVSARRIGYGIERKPVTVVADQEVRVDFALTATAAVLGEVVTTATGEQRKREVGNAISTIKADAVVATAPVASLSDVVMARAPGVQVYSTGGLTGASPQINIRGQNSLSLSNQPLLIIDGVRVDNSAVGSTRDNQYSGQSAGRFNDLIPGEIESIEVVKGPSAATLYGTDAANGVILVKTKRGVAGRPQWSIHAEQGLLTMDRDRFFPNYYAWGRTTDASQATVNCTLQLLAAGQCAQDSVTSFNPVRFAPTTPIGTGSLANYGVQVSGGGDTRYFVSGTYAEETGYLKMPDVERERIAAKRGAIGLSEDELHPNGLSRYGVRTNLTTTFGTSADLSISTGLISQHSRIPSAAALTYSIGPGYRDANDGWNYGVRPGDLFAQRRDEGVKHFTASATPTWRPATWLSTRATAGIDFSSTYYDAFIRPGEGGVFSDGTGFRENMKTNVTLYTVDASATANANLSRHLTSRTSAGVQYNRRQLLLNAASATRLAIGSETVAGGGTRSSSEATTESVIAGAYAEQTFGVNDRLFLTGAVRADGGSTFGDDFKTAIYPKGSISWVISDEPFWPRVPGLSSLRLRAAYGASGVQPSSIAALARDTLFPGIADGSVAPGGVLVSAGNPHLKPERQREFEGGADMDWFAGRLKLELTYYNKRSSDALVDVPRASSIGGGVVTKNIGAVRNSGYEALVDARVIDHRDLTWDVSLNGSINHNKLITLGSGILPTYNPYGVPSIVPGYPLFAYFDYPIESYSDANGNGILEPSELTLGSAPAYRGPSYPTSQLTVSSTLGLLGDRVRIAALVDHRGGLDLANRSRSDRCVGGYCQGAIDPHAPLSDQAAVLAYSAAFNYSYWGFFENGAFTRFRELSLAYRLPDRLTRFLHARNATLTVAGRNLWLWTSFRDTDPEVQTIPGFPQYGAFFAEGGLPPARYLTLRLNLGF